MWGLLIALVAMLAGFKLFGETGFFIVLLATILCIGAYHTGMRNDEDNRYN